MANLGRFEIKCASCGFYVYREIWKPNSDQELQVKHEDGNIHDSFSMAFKLKTKETSTAIFVGHIPGELSRFCRYFMDYGELLEAHVRYTKGRVSPIPNRGLEIRVRLVVKKGTSNEDVFLKKKLADFYIDPDLIVKKHKQNDEEQASDDDFLPAEEATVANKQFVDFDNCLSTPQSVLTSVPQGSILGPLLFIFLMNNIEDGFQKCNIMLYADDAVLFTPSKNSSDIEEDLNLDSLHINRWFIDNNLIVNLKKGNTEFILFGTAQKLKKLNKIEILFNNNTINETSNYEYLGVVFYKSLIFFSSSRQSIQESCV